MTIYILDENQKKCAQCLDDKSLNRMIKGVAQVLCDAHYFLSEGDYKKNYPTPLPLSSKSLAAYILSQYNCWSSWTRECKPNYMWLVDLSYALDEEHQIRYTQRGHQFPIFSSYRKVIEWAYNNVPDLPSVCLENINFPLVIPKKYVTESYFWYQINDPQKINNAKIECYRNYYQAKIKRFHDGNVCSHLKWTKRQKPSWLIFGEISE